MSHIGSFTPVTFVDGTTPAINAVNLNAVEDALDRVDHDASFSNANGFKYWSHYLLHRNTKLIDAFGGNSSDWTSAGTTTLSSDYNSIYGKTGLKILETDNTAGYCSAYKAITSMDLTKFESGEAASTSDAIAFGVYISDVTKVQYLAYKLGADNSNNYSLTWPGSSLVTGWNFLVYQRSDFTSAGSPNWAAITYIRCEWQSTSNAQNVYCTYGILALQRSEGGLGGSNPFTIDDGAAHWDRYVFDWAYDCVLYQDYVSKLVGFLLAAENNSSSTHIQVNTGHAVDEFMYSVSLVCRYAGETCCLVDWVDSSNFCKIYITGSVLTMELKQSGSTTTVTSTLASTLEKEDNVTLVFKKEGDIIRAWAFIDGQRAHYVESECTLSGDGYLWVGHKSVNAYSFITEVLFTKNVIDLVDVHNGAFWRKPRMIRKSVNTLLYSDATLNDDADMYCKFPPNGVFKVELDAHWLNGVTEKAKCAWTLGTGLEAMSWRNCILPTGTSANIVDTNVEMKCNDYTTPVTVGSDGTNMTYHREVFYISSGPNGGKLTFQWCQNTSGGNASILAWQTMMIVTKLN